MSDVRTRKKSTKDSPKKTQEVPKRKNGGATAGDVDTVSSFSTTFIWLPVVLAVGVYLYLVRQLPGVSYRTVEVIYES
ncbi:hypothetical protein CVT26_004973 [Gymnopilus dilepis]|uniref:Uncharacterized protein n=1 Tax=Gymnopilus dilepis TaxID=231916 RepID=A0A409Y077_9AGAR|nr:hypothetical protein CVT26_004973 [Gymnopilus dilepis]